MMYTKPATAANGGPFVNSAIIEIKNTTMKALRTTIDDVTAGGRFSKLNDSRFGIVWKNHKDSKTQTLEAAEILDARFRARIQHCFLCKICGLAARATNANTILEDTRSRLGGKLGWAACRFKGDFKRYPCGNVGTGG